MRHIHLMALVVLIASPVSVSAATEQSTIGNTQVIVKTVTGIVDGTTRTLKFQDDVYHNERIETGDESATQLQFLDETKVTLGPNSELVLDRFVYDPNSGKGSFVMTATAGAFRFASGKLPSKSYKIHTPAATLGVRVTVFEFFVTRLDADGHRVALDISLQSGAIEIYTCSGKYIELTEVGASTRIVHDLTAGCAAN